MRGQVGDCEGSVAVGLRESTTEFSLCGKGYI